MQTFKDFMGHSDRIIDQEEVIHLTGVSRSHISRLEKSGLFPRRIKVGSRRVGWSLLEIQEWMKDIKIKRDFNNIKKDK